MHAEIREQHRAGIELIHVRAVADVDRLDRVLQLRAQPRAAVGEHGSADDGRAGARRRGDGPEVDQPLHTLCGHDVRAQVAEGRQAPVMAPVSAVAGQQPTTKDQQLAAACRRQEVVVGPFEQVPRSGRVEGVLRLARRALIDGSGEAGVPVVQPYQRLHLQPHVVLLDRLRRPRGAAAVADEVGAPEVDEGQFHAAGHVTCSRASRSRDRRSGMKDLACDSVGNHHAPEPDASIQQYPHRSKLSMTSSGSGASKSSGTSNRPRSRPNLRRGLDVA